MVLESACLLFFFTILFIFRPSKLLANIIFVFFFCNPILIYICNYILSDSLFTAVSILWVTQLMWIIYRPRPYMILVQALLLVFAFSIRYSALYYPIFATVVLLFSRLSIRYKMTGILLQFVLVVSFIFYTRGAMLGLTGVRQFSPFGGWQAANNALYMYSHVYNERADAIPVQFYPLDSTVRSYFDRTHRTESLLDYNAEGTGFYYMIRGPLITYMNMNWQNGPDTTLPNLRKFGPAGYTYSEYGGFLIKRYPVEFLRYWAFPNSIRYFYPPTEMFSKLSPYIFRPDEYGKTATQLFGIRTLAVNWPLIHLQMTLTSWYPMFFMLLNLSFVLAFIGFYFFGGLKMGNKVSLYVLLFITLLWLCNLCFSALAACTVLRYQIFIMLVEFPFVLLLADFIYQGIPQKVKIAMVNDRGKS